jgi:catechol 2,3-dioxygenase-like lactoylglutathione lyase family enzyme
MPGLTPAADDEPGGSGTATCLTAEGADAMDVKLEVVTIPVSDVERAKEFYGRLGWRPDDTPPWVVRRDWWLLGAVHETAQTYGDVPMVTCPFRTGWDGVCSLGCGKGRRSVAQRRPVPAGDGPRVRDVQAGWLVSGDAVRRLHDSRPGGAALVPRAG